jgi:hypothetical protein
MDDGQAGFAPRGRLLYSLLQPEALRQLINQEPPCPQP